jgi:hypothetical protein
LKTVIVRPRFQNVFPLFFEPPEHKDDQPRYYTKRADRYDRGKSRMQHDVFYARNIEPERFKGQAQAS